MVINKQLREDILKKNQGITKRRIDQIIKKYGKDKKIVNRDIAGYAYAHDVLGINLKARKYSIDEDILNKVQSALQSGPQIIVKEKLSTKKNNVAKPKKIIKFIEYDTDDTFILGHIHEVNICYTYHAYTAAFILCRKIIENLLIEIIVKKYPQKKDNIDLYYDKTKNRIQDFSQILRNLRLKINDFGAEKSLLDRILNKTEIFKDEANNKTHSSYHLLRGPKELDNANVPDILIMIHKLENSLK